MAFFVSQLVFACPANIPLPFWCWGIERVSGGLGRAEMGQHSQGMLSMPMAHTLLSQL